MSPVLHPIVIDQGSAYDITFYYTDINGNPIDVSNYCVTIQWKTNTGDDYYFSNKYNGNAYSLQSNTDGTIVFRIPSKTTNTYEFDNAGYDLDIQEPNEEYAGSGLKTYRLVTGTVTINRRNTSISLIDCAYASSVFNIATNCELECSRLDLYSVQYSGSGLIIQDNSAVSGTVSTTDTRLIDNIEIAVNGLRHNSPQDLMFLLAPPTGGTVLLSANAKISKYAPGFSCLFSNRAPNGAFINNIDSGGLCLIRDKTNNTQYNNETVLSSFDHLFGSSVTGNWSLIICDTDPGIAGSIDSWKLIITYQP